MKNEVLDRAGCDKPRLWRDTLVGYIMNTRLVHKVMEQIKQWKGRTLEVGKNVDMKADLYGCGINVEVKRLVEVG